MESAIMLPTGGPQIGDTLPAPASAPAAAAVQFVCSEVWGGNRPINRGVEAPGVRGKLFSKPCGGESGGDVHYMSVCASGLLTRLCVADVAGHGEQVAGVSRELHGLLRRYMNSLDQRRVLADLNRTLESSDAPVMTTAAAFTYYPPSGALSYSYAGHPPAWVFDAARERWELLTLAAESGGRDGGGAPRASAARRKLENMPLSVDRDTRFTQGKRRMSIGDRILIVTDGVIEAPSPAGELFGEQRVQQLLNEGWRLDTVALADRLVQALVEFTTDARLAHDDVTFFMLEITAGPPGPPVWHAIRNFFRAPRGNSAALEAAGEI